MARRCGRLGLSLLVAALVGCALDTSGLGGGSASSPGTADTNTSSSDTLTTAEPTSTSPGSSGSTETSPSGDETDDTASPTTGDDDGTTTDPTAGSSSESTGNPPSPCDVDNGGCHPDASCEPTGEGIKCACARGMVGDGYTCATEPTLEVLRSELPCIDYDQCGGPATCTTAASVTEHAMFDGDPGVVYRATLRIRGVVEPNTYDVPCDGPWCVGGVGAGNPWNEHALEIANPPATFHLNGGQAGMLEVFAIDETREVDIEGDTELTLSIDGNGTCSVSNGAGVVVPRVDPDPIAFPGQFVQVDLVSAELP